MPRPFIFIRQGETWIGKWGFFYDTIYGIELPTGKFFGFTRSV